MDKPGGINQEKNQENGEKKVNHTSNSRPFWHFGRCERRQKWQIHLIVHLTHAWVMG